MKHYIKTSIQASLVLLVVVAVIPAYSMAQDLSSETRVKHDINEMHRYRDEAQKLAPNEIYKEIKAGIELGRILYDGKDPFAAMMTPSHLKLTGYVMALEKGKKDKDPASAYYYGLYNTGVCGGLQGVLDKANDLVKNCFKESLESFEIAAHANIASASYNIGVYYENGWGTITSKYAAADWYEKAAKQYVLEDSRDMALTSMERALTLIPDHPGALKVRKSLLQ